MGALYSTKLGLVEDPMCKHICVILVFWLSLCLEVSPSFYMPPTCPQGLVSSTTALSTKDRLIEYIDAGQASVSDYDFVSADSSIFWTSSRNYTCDGNTSSAAPEVINTTEIIPNMASWLNTTGAR